jgi:hypothetical protein
MITACTFVLKTASPDHVTTMLCLSVAFFRCVFSFTREKMLPIMILKEVASAILYNPLVEDDSSNRNNLHHEVESAEDRNNTLPLAVDFPALPGVLFFAKNQNPLNHDFHQRPTQYYQHEFCVVVAFQTDSLHPLSRVFGGHILVDNIFPKFSKLLQFTSHHESKRCNTYIGSMTLKVKP